ncbi:hypothetical protein FB451DRAFT_1376668 [Mycena latifolia]|nr:hypothetical protein FB451DRAFT_1376668 [Mycena latifolia]
MSGGSGSGSGAMYYEKELKELLRIFHILGRYGLCQVCPEDCEAGLAAVDEANETSQPGSLPPGSLVFELDGVDISMPFFRDCLSDVPVDGADNIKSLSSWAVTSGKKGSKSARLRQRSNSGGRWRNSIFSHLAQHVCKHVYKRACLQTSLVSCPSASYVGLSSSFEKSWMSTARSRGPPGHMKDSGAYSDSKPKGKLERDCRVTFTSNNELCSVWDTFCQHLTSEQRTNRRRDSDTTLPHVARAGPPAHSPGGAHARLSHAVRIRVVPRPLHYACHRAPPAAAARRPNAITHVHAPPLLPGWPSAPYTPLSFEVRRRLDLDAGEISLAIGTRMPDLVPDAPSSINFHCANRRKQLHRKEGAELSLEATAEHFANQEFDSLGVGGGNESDIQLELVVHAAARAERKIYPLAQGKCAQPYADLMLIVLHTRGEIFGGSSAINFMVWQHRGNTISGRQYLETGLDGKLKLGLLPPASPVILPGKTSSRLAKSYRINGPVVTSVNQPMVPAGIELGLKANFNPDLGDPIGFSSTARSMDSAKEICTHATGSYYTPNAHRKNLILLTGAQVTKVVFDTKTGIIAKRLNTVRVPRPVVIFKRRSRKEKPLRDIGTLKTSQILELSGVGDKELLAKYDIPLAFDFAGLLDLVTPQYSILICFRISHFSRADFKLKPGAVTFDTGFTCSPIPASQLRLDELKFKTSLSTSAVVTISIQVFTLTAQAVISKNFSVRVRSHVRSSLVEPAVLQCLVSGGWWRPSGSPEYVRAGKKIISFLEKNKELQRRLGWMDKSKPTPGSVKHESRRKAVTAPWREILGDSGKPEFDPREAGKVWTTCNHMWCPDAYAGSSTGVGNCSAPL